MAGINIGRSAVINPLNNPYWSTASSRGGYSTESLGNGDGTGVFDWQALAALGYDVSGLMPAPTYGDESPAQPSAQAYADFLQRNGLTLREEAEGESALRYVTDANGNLVGDPQSYSYNDDQFWTAALLAGALTGASIYGAGAGVGAAGETAALSSGQVGALSGAGEAGFAGLSSVPAAGTAGGTGLTAAGTAGAVGGTGLTFGGGTATGLGSTGLGVGAGTAGTVAGAGGLAGSGLTVAGSTAGGAATGLASTGLGTASGTGLFSSLGTADWLKLGTQAIGSIGSSYAQGQAAKDASAAQQAAAVAGQAQLAPYAAAGTSSLKAQQDLAGLNGAAAQQAAIAALQASPEFTAKLALGEKSILSNASATGGLRGGNVQAALAQFSPQLLADQINQQYTRLGGLTQTGLSASGGVVNLMQQGGAAAAGGELAQGRATAGYIGALVNAAGLYAGLSGW